MNGTFCDYVVVPEHFVFPVPQGTEPGSRRPCGACCSGRTGGKPGACPSGGRGSHCGGRPVGLRLCRPLKRPAAAMPYVWIKLRNVWNGRSSWERMKFSSPRIRSLRLKIKGILCLKPPGTTLPRPCSLPWPARRQMRAGGVAGQQHRSCGCGKADGKGTGLPWE